MKTTKRHYDYFRSRCLYYQKELGLMGWDLSFRRENIEGFASCRSDSDDKWCTIRFCTNWNKHTPLTLRELDATALHEVLHLRIGDILWLGKSRYVTPDEIDRAGEEVVTALDNFYRTR